VKCFMYVPISGELARRIALYCMVRNDVHTRSSAVAVIADRTACSSTIG